MILPRHLQIRRRSPPAVLSAKDAVARWVDGSEPLHPLRQKLVSLAEEADYLAGYSDLQSEANLMRQLLEDLEQFVDECVEILANGAVRYEVGGQISIYKCSTIQRKVPQGELAGGDGWVALRCLPISHDKAPLLHSLVVMEGLCTSRRDDAERKRAAEAARQRMNAQARSTRWRSEERSSRRRKTRRDLVSPAPKD